MWFYGLLWAFSEVLVLLPQRIQKHSKLRSSKYSCSDGFSEADFLFTAHAYLRRGCGNIPKFYVYAT
jgi:hypothetical protein